MAKNRKKIFPKPPVRYHSKLAKELGKYSNKTDVRANLIGIYYQPIKNQAPELTQKQETQLEKLRANIAKRDV